MDDLVILVDRDDREIGTEEKLPAHRDGRLHRAVSVFVFDGDALLLQRRAPTKYHSAGLWSNTACGHPRPGEAAVAAAARRLREEMGLVCALEPAFAFIYRAELAGGLVEHELDHVFVARANGAGAPSPDGNEVSEWRWERLDALRAALEADPASYTAWLPIALGELERRGWR